PEALATVPRGDDETVARLAAAGLDRADQGDPTRDPTREGALASLQASLFGGTPPTAGALDDGVVILSAPGESRECVEIARRIVAAARTGTPFDRMAILLRSVDEYRPHLEEALSRAGIPAFFARGAIRPDPTGRAFVALLACAAERLSARRFAEYLSLGVVPDATRAGAPPPPSPRAERWVAPEEEMLPETIAEAVLASSAGELEEAAPAADPDAAPVVAGTLRAPRRWEQLLVEAAVIGGRERWQGRLAGLEQELRADLDELRARDPDDPTSTRIERQLADLEALR